MCVCVSVTMAKMSKRKSTTTKPKRTLKKKGTANGKTFTDKQLKCQENMRKNNKSVQKIIKAIRKKYPDMPFNGAKKKAWVLLKAGKTPYTFQTTKNDNL